MYVCTHSHKIFTIFEIQITTTCLEALIISVINDAEKITRYSLIMQITCSFLFPVKLFRFTVKINIK